MEVYFIRHGVTEANARNRHQPPESRLSPLGIRQSEQVAHALRGKNIELILSSDLPRTLETAEIIGKELFIPVQKTEELREIRRPSSLFGKSHYHPKSFSYVLHSMFQRSNREWHLEDAESLLEVHERTHHVAQLLESLHEKHERIAVVSHAVFLEILMSNLCKNGTLGFFDYLPIFSPFSQLRNASVSTFTYHPAAGAGVCAWQQHTVNNTSHLAG